MTANLLTVYVPLFGWMFVGWVVGRWLPAAAPVYLGRFLFWVGVPFSIVAFLRHAHLSRSLWLAPVVAWIAMLVSVSLAWWLSRSKPGEPLRMRWWQRPLTERRRGSFLLASMVGNTGYIGYPVSLALVGPHYFAWALFYDLLGSTPGAYGLGVAIAARFSGQPQQDNSPLWRVLAINPALWSFGVGLVGRNWPLPGLVETGLHGFAWCVVSLSLLLVGMRLSQLGTLKGLKSALLSVSIKMLIVPLLLGLGLKGLGVTGPVHSAIVLQMAMPPAFATLVLAEAYELDQEFTVTTLMAGCLGLLVALPIWVGVFGISGMPNLPN